MISYDSFKLKLLTSEQIIYRLLINLFNTFCETGGVDSILKILDFDNIKEKAKEVGYDNYVLNIDAISMVLSPLKGVKYIINEATSKEIVEAAKNAYIKWLKLITDKDIKDIKRDIFNTEMENLKDLFKLVLSDEEINSIVQESEMIISLKFFQAKSLEKRLNGIIGIRKIVNRVFVENNCEILLKWIIDNNIVPKILDEDAHQEVIKRAFDIFCFLAKGNAITKDILELLWKCQEEKHEDIVRAIYDTIKNLVEFLNPECIKFLYDKISSQQLESYNLMFLTFIKDFTHKAFAVNAKNDIEQYSEEIIDKISDPETGNAIVPNDEELYFVRVFWDLIQDTSLISQELTIEALNCFKELLLSKMKKKYKVQYLYLCIENLKAHKSVPQSIELAKYILEKVIEASVDNWIKKLMKDYDLVNILIEDCELYKETVGKQIKNDEKNIEKAVFSGKLNHAYNLEERLVFLQAIFKISEYDMKMTEEIITKLCKLYIENPACEFDTKAFLTKLSPVHRTLISILPAKEQQFLFDIIFKERPKLQNNFPLHFYYSFGTLWNSFNLAAKSIEISNNYIRILEFNNIFGLDQLWDCVRYAEHPDSRERFTKLLIDIYKNFSDDIPLNKKEEIMHNFVDRCFKNIIKEENNLVISNILNLLSMMFDSFNGHKYDTTEESLNQHVLEISMGSSMSFIFPR